MPPLVSICIPAYNAETTIFRCLQSVIDQQVEDTEIVLVDNCSTDRTVELAHDVLNGQSNVRVIQNTMNVGRIGNWNRCLEEARGRYIKFAFTNDAMLQGALSLFLDKVRGEPDVCWVGSDSQTVSSLPDVIPHVNKEAEFKEFTEAEAVLFFASQGFLTGSLNGMLFDRGVIQRHNLRFDESIPYFADFSFTIELSQRGKGIRINTPTYCFNEGVSGRYHHVGMKNARTFFLEQRRCTDDLAKALLSTGRNPELAFAYLRGRFFYYLGQGANVRPFDAFEIFRGRPLDQLAAASKTWWFRRSYRPLTPK